jgi:HSP20 family molecular chaperone IbpA
MYLMKSEMTDPVERTAEPLDGVQRRWTGRIKTADVLYEDEVEQTYIVMLGLPGCDRNDISVMRREQLEGQRKDVCYVVAEIRVTFDGVLYQWLYTHDVVIPPGYSHGVMKVEILRGIVMITVRN